MVDVSDRWSVVRCVRSLENAGIRVDVLINNAAVYQPETVLGTSAKRFREVIDINFPGALWMIQVVVPGMLSRRYGRIVNVSFGESLEGPAAYCISKAAFDSLTFKLEQELTGDIKVDAVCTGCVRTRMGGFDAQLAVEESVDTILWLASLPKSGPTGGFFRDRARLPLSSNQMS